MPKKTVPREGRIGVLTFATVVSFIILCGLGVWQIQRLAWKTNLINEVETRTDLPPEAAPAPAAWPTLDLDDADFLPVSVTGTFHNDEEVHVYEDLQDPVGPLGGSGYFILTPFQTTDGWWVIVNRGFVPDDHKDPATRQADQIEGVTTVAGLLRQPQGRNAFTPADEIDNNIWFTRNPAAIGKVLDLTPDQLAPYYVDANFDPALPDAMPQGGETLVTFPNNHLQYAITWFGLAAVLLVIYFFKVRQMRRKPEEGAAQA